jgi:hypothetical protein
MITHAEAAQLARMWVQYPAQRARIDVLLAGYINQFDAQHEMTVRRWLGAVQLQGLAHKHGWDDEFARMTIPDSPFCDQFHK